MVRTKANSNYPMLIRDLIGGGGEGGAESVFADVGVSFRGL
jgi:hypothetical protein